MSKNNTNTAADITAKINNPELAAAYKRIVVTDNADKKGTYDIAVEFLRKHGGSPWRRAEIVEGFTAEQAAVAACVLRAYCIEETRQIDVKDHLPNPDADKKQVAAKRKTRYNRKHNKPTAKSTARTEAV
jgi:hypothetical protein